MAKSSTSAATPAEQAILTLYANLMDEVKVRIDCIDRAVRGQTGFPGPIVREFCYGQLRLLCELIALSCLVAHGDIAATHSKRIGKKWSAQEIMDELTKLREHFYPIAMRQTPPPPGTKVWGMEGAKAPSFTKEALLQLYGKCHARMHRGNVEKLLKSATPIDMDTNFPEIISWAQKIQDQLAVHIVPISKDGEKLMFCILRNQENNGKVQTGHLVKGVAPPPASPPSAEIA
jgi:hypothetical protein